MAPDLLRGLAAQITTLARVALRSLLKTLLVALLGGAALAALSAAALWQSHPGVAALAGATALVEALAVGLAVGRRRALVAAITHGLQEHRLGRTAVRALFDATPALPGAAQAGGEALVVAARRLQEAPAGGGGWLRRRLQGRLIELVTEFTRTSYRAPGGGPSVDVLASRAEIEETIDERLSAWLRGRLTRSAWLAALALAALAAAQVAVLFALFRDGAG